MGSAEHSNGARTTRPSDGKTVVVPNLYRRDKADGTASFQVAGKGVPSKTFDNEAAAYSYRASLVEDGRLAPLSGEAGEITTTPAGTAAPRPSVSSADPSTERRLRVARNQSAPAVPMRAPVAFVRSLASRLAAEADLAAQSTGHGSALDQVAAFVADVARRHERHEALDQLVESGVLPDYIRADVPLPARTPTSVDEPWAFVLWTACGGNQAYNPGTDGRQVRYLTALGSTRAYVDPAAVLVALTACALRDRNDALRSAEAQSGDTVRERDAALRDVGRLSGEIAHVREERNAIAASLTVARAKTAQLEQALAETEERVRWLRSRDNTTEEVAAA